jgi:hypothetical protein
MKRKSLEAKSSLKRGQLEIKFRESKSFRRANEAKVVVSVSVVMFSLLFGDEVETEPADGQQDAGVEASEAENIAHAYAHSVLVVGFAPKSG